MTITVQDDFTPISIDFTSHYSAKKQVIFEMNVECDQNYKVTFSKFNEEIEIPNLDQVKDKFFA